MKKILVIFILLFSSITLFIISNQKENEVILSNINNNIEGLAFYLQSEEGSEEYNSADTIPSKDDGYIFKEAVCNDESNVSFNNATWALKVSNMESGKVRCKLYFDIDDAIARRYILSQNTVNEGTPDFSEIATTNEGIFTAEDDYGTSYYYRGAVDNNYFYFAGFYWRIIRINGDGTVRLIYQGTSPTSTGENANAIKSAWNTEISDNAYIGYMYGTPGSSTYEKTHANINNTTIKTSLDNWYQSNLLDYEEYISKESTFCGDRQLSSGTGTGTSLTTYLPSTRLSKHEPTLKCANEQDLYTLKDASIGNKALTYPIALITADEVAFAGAVTSGTGGEANNKFYLYTGTTWRTMTPESYGSYNNGNNPKVFGVDGEGILRWFQGASGSHGVRPVININKNVILNGNGTASDPYRIINTDLEDLTAKDVILSNSKLNEGTPNFSQLATTDEGLYKAEDNDGTSYYFRGAVTNNYVKLGNFYWRIIRINGNGSIRLIYDGTNVHENGESSTNRQISEGQFNKSYNASYYVGYTYVANAQRPSSQNAGTSSTIKQTLENWYNNNLNSYDSLIDTTSGFCNDRDIASGESWNVNTSLFEYKAFERLNTNKKPTIKCSNNMDLYTTKIGLISADEVAMAGAVYNKNNTDFYLYTGQTFWTISPGWLDARAGGGATAGILTLRNNGLFIGNSVDEKISIRPVINLKADTKLKGTGKSFDPYVVVGAE